MQRSARAGLDVSDSLSPEEIAKEIASQIAKNGGITYGGAEHAANETESKAAGGAEKNADAESRNIVDCRNLYFSYDGAEEHALNGVSLQIREGEFFGIIGHTGSGKSTFVRHLNALEKLPTAQKKYKPKKKKKNAAEISEEKRTVLTVDGFDLTDKTTDFFALRSKVGMVFQYPEYQLFAETVAADVAFGLKNFSKTPLSAEETGRAVKEALETVGLKYEEVKDKSPFELSGGQKRRVAIAGVIVTKPEILVLDEPAAGLDPLGKEEIAALLKKVHSDWCKTVIVVSHDMDEIAESCDRAAVFSDGKIAFCRYAGKIVYAGRGSVVFAGTRYSRNGENFPRAGGGRHCRPVRSDGKGVRERRGGTICRGQNGKRQYGAYGNGNRRGGRIRQCRFGRENCGRR